MVVSEAGTLDAKLCSLQNLAWLVVEIVVVIALKRASKCCCGLRLPTPAPQSVSWYSTEPPDSAAMQSFRTGSPRFSKACSFKLLHSSLLASCTPVSAWPGAVFPVSAAASNASSFAFLASLLVIIATSSLLSFVCLSYLINWAPIRLSLNIQNNKIK